MTIVIPVLGQITGSGSFVGDKAIAVTQASYKLLRLGGSKLVPVLEKLRFKQAAEFIGGLLTVVVKRGLTKFGPGSPIWDNATQLLDEFGQMITGIFEALTSLAQRFGVTGLLKYGNSEGGLVLGRLLNLSDEAASYSDETYQGVVKIADGVGEAIADLSDNAVAGLGRLVDSVGGERAYRLLNTCSITGGPASPGRIAGLASPLQVSICDPDIFEKVLANVKAWDAAAIDGFRSLTKAGVNDKVLNDILIKYIDDVSTSNKVLGIFGANPTKAAELLGQFGDNAVEFVGRYGDDGFEALDRFKDEAVELLEKFGDDVVEGQYIGSYLAKIKNTVEFERTKVKLSQGFEVSRLANDSGVDIHIVGRWADTPDEAIIRQKAFVYSQKLIKDYNNGAYSIPNSVQDVINLYPDRAGEIIDFWVKEEAARKFKLSWPQVKISTGGSEVDVFINNKDWKSLPVHAQEQIEENLLRIFSVDEADFYQKLGDKLEPWELILSKHNPLTVPPPGSLNFLPDGTIIHDLLGN